jgi:outer membrane protein assembly factor BamB
MRPLPWIATTAAWVLLACPAAHAADWLQWRGPEMNGSADEEKNLPVSFSRTENLAWAAPLPGPGGSTPIVVGDRIFLTSHDKRGADLLGMCLRATDGTVLWSKPLSKGKPGPGGAIAACSPASDGKKVFFLFGTGDLAAVDLDGKPLWTRQLATDYGPFAIRFGYSASPLLLKGRLYIPLLRTEEAYPFTPGATDSPVKGPLKSLVLCLDAETGKTVWQQVRDTDATKDSRDTYITPMAVEAKGRTEIVICGGEFMTAHDAATGQELWRWEYTKKREIWQRIVSSPVIVDGLILSCQAFGQAMFALRPGASGTVAHDDVAWQWQGPAADVCSPLAYRGSLYVLSGDKLGKFITCLDPKTGKVKWSSKFDAAGPWRASPTGADGKIFCISEGGDYVVLAAGDKFEELFRCSLKGGPCHSTVVVAGGRILIRTAGELLCVRKAQ